MTAFESEDLLKAARAMLVRSDGAGLPPGVWPRVVAVLTRQALEASLARLWHDAGLDMARASTRAQLLCLEEYLADPDLAATASFAWWALSRACHHHPYELSPTFAELDRCVTAVEAVAAAVRAPA